MAVPAKRKAEHAADSLLMAAGGLEAEFALIVDDQPARPEDVFGDPRGFLRVPLMHRTGRSFHLPNGAAVYFDTGVIEIATPAMELARGCFLRLARSLHEALAVVRAELDVWQMRTRRRVRLQGFSAHYNISANDSTAARLKTDAWVLAHVLPAPVMLIATNRRSTGVGVRPRPRRIEITVDYSPDASRIAATGAVVAGIVRAITAWSERGLEALRARHIPLMVQFSPMRHTSRRGWLARFDCFPLNPFACHVDSAVWQTTEGRLTLRALARRVVDAFDSDIAALADAASYRLARRIVEGRAASWLDDADRPAAYDDAGRSDDAPVVARAGLSKYERVVRNAVNGRRLKLDDEWWIPVRVRGWSRIVLRRERDGAYATHTLDDLVEYLDRW